MIASWLDFFIGLEVGTVFGLFLASLMIVARRHDDEARGGR